MFPRIPPEVPIDVFLSGARLRSQEELVAQADLYYCLDASLRDDSLWNAPVETRYPMVQIVMERRRANDWLLVDHAWWDLSLDT